MFSVKAQLIILTAVIVFAITGVILSSVWLVFPLIGVAGGETVLRLNRKAKEPQ
jgi:hypothetical protein